MKRTLLLFATIALVVVSTLAPVRPDAAAAAGGSTLARPEDPVVLTGADVPSLNGIATGELVAFRYDTGWVQIPVQVDERDTKSFLAIYNNLAGANISILQYTDANTFTGPDSNPQLDSNDEIAFMADDAGGIPPAFSEPAGVVSSTGIQLTIADPLDIGAMGYVYLFQQDGTLSPGAGQSYVTYGFNLLSGNYMATYNMNANGGNPENSTVTTPNYTYHFGDRWQEDQMKISVGGATNVDILDRHKALFYPGVCARSEDTFDGIVVSSPIEGAFVANKSGPVRAIRSYVGANSGPLTEREHIFYAQRQDIRTNLRVHAISGVMDFFDYSPAASGMTYYNDLNTGGVPVDGVQDTVTPGAIGWQMVTGAQGTVVQAGSTATNIPGFAYTSYYLDKAPPPALTGIDAQCTGDSASYGASGVWVNQAIPCTDPGMGCTNYMNTTNTLYYAGPSQPVSAAQALNNQAKIPLTYTASAWQDLLGDADGDGIANGVDNCLSVINPAQVNSDAANGAANRPGTDTSGDECDADDDGDGYTDAQETPLAENPLVYCVQMRADVDGDHSITILDLSLIAQSYGQMVPPAPARRSQDADTSITILDLSKVATVFMQSVSVCP